MSDYTRHQQNGSKSTRPYNERGGCAPDHEPANQPKPPNPRDCEELCAEKPPDFCEPKRGKPQCCCPGGPTTPSNCLDELIKDQTKDITEAERSKSFKDELVALQEKAKAGAAAYTPAEYERLLNKWKQLDGEIVDLIRKLVCAFPCWWCLIECHICPLLYEIRYREQKLSGNGKLYEKVNSLYDLRYWHQRNVDAKRAVFERIRDVLTAWENPAETIAAALDENEKLIREANLSASDAAKLVYDVFLQLVPRHLAIAPPVDPENTPPELRTCIDDQYTKFCHCDVGAPKPDDCCGPNVAEWSLRQRFIGPKAYLIHPDQYFTIICCLARERYLPAKNALAQAEANLTQTEGEIESYQNDIRAKLESFAGDATAALIRQPIRCDEYEEHPLSTA